MHSLSGITTEAFKRMRLPFGSGLGGKVAELQKGVLISDYFQEVESPVHDVVRAEGLISGIAVPIQIGRTTQGSFMDLTGPRPPFPNQTWILCFLLGISLPLKSPISARRSTF